MVSNAGDGVSPSSASFLEGGAECFGGWRLIFACPNVTILWAECGVIGDYKGKIKKVKIPPCAATGFFDILCIRCPERGGSLFDNGPYGRNKMFV